MKKNSVWNILSGISFFVSLIFLYMGFDKIYSYDNGELYPYTYHNAYVGGDAYNYIINGNYATAYFVLTLTFAMDWLLRFVIYEENVRIIYGDRYVV